MTKVISHAFAKTLGQTENPGENERNTFSLDASSAPCREQLLQTKRTLQLGIS